MIKTQTDRFHAAFNYLSTDASFSLQLKQYCERGGRAHYDAIADAAHLDVAYVYRLVNGEKVHPSASTVIRLALALNLTVPETDELLMVAGYAPLVPPGRDTYGE